MPSWRCCLFVVKPTDLLVATVGIGMVGSIVMVEMADWWDCRLR